MFAFLTGLVLWSSPVFSTAAAANCCDGCVCEACGCECFVTGDCTCEAGCGCCGAADCAAACCSADRPSAAAPTAAAVDCCQGCVCDVCGCDCAATGVCVCEPDCGCTACGAGG